MERPFFSGVNHFGGGEGSYIWTAYYMDPDERSRADLIFGDGGIHKIDV